MRCELMRGVLSAALLLIGVGEASAARPCEAPPPALGRWQAAGAASLPDQPWFDADGSERRLTEATGKGLIVNFWATWCAPCVKEMPALDRLSAAVAGDGIVVLPLSADREGAPVVEKFYEVNKLTNLPVAIDRMGRIARALGVVGLPTTVLFDDGGREVGRIVGVAEWDEAAAIAFLRRCLRSGGDAG